MERLAGGLAPGEVACLSVLYIARVGLEQCVEIIAVAGYVRLSVLYIARVGLERRRAPFWKFAAPTAFSPLHSEGGIGTLDAARL